MSKNSGLQGERGVIRDPKSGQIIIQPAYEGWKPKEVDNSIGHGMVLVLIGVILVVAAIQFMPRPADNITPATFNQEQDR